MKACLTKLVRRECGCESYAHIHLDSLGREDTQELEGMTCPLCVGAVAELHRQQQLAIDSVGQLDLFLASP